jgi:hypothetical protein
MPRQYDIDPAVTRARGQLAEALKNLKADEAAEAARRLVEAKRLAKRTADLKNALEVVAAAGYKVAS